MEFHNKYILILYLFILFAGTLFFIPTIFVNRFITAPALWMQLGLSIGIIGYVILTKERIHLPPKSFIFLMTIWIVYHVWQSRENIEEIIDIISLTAAFFLFYAIWLLLKDKALIFTLFTLLSLMLSLWGLGQFTGLLSSYGSFVVTGPFDNPAGISASLVALLPFSLYCCLYLENKYRFFAFITICMAVSVIVLSQARAAILAMVVVLIFFFIHLLKRRNIKLSTVHYTAISIGCILLFSGLVFMKKNSAKGRLLIWQCSGQLIAKKPVIGYGGNGFTANYMDGQASYFTSHPDSKYAMLADNVRHPFNEFLKWAVNYGLTGLSLTLLLVITTLWVSRKNESQELFFVRLGILSIVVCAFFSYPFNYPFIRLMAVSLIAFALATNPKKGITITNGYLAKGLAILFSLGLLSVSAYQAYFDYEWNAIAHKSLRGETKAMLPRYKSLYKHLRYKDLFLYNYAAELNVVGQYANSLQIARKCNELWVDYDLQMLMADNCLKLQLYNETENHLKKAAAMCPVKFMTLYQLVELYAKTGRIEEARILAQKILDKKVKVSSPVINSIKNKMENFLEESENLTCSPISIIHDVKSIITPSWQDCVLDLRTPRALLPT